MKPTRALLAVALALAAAASLLRVTALAPGVAVVVDVADAGVCAVGADAGNAPIVDAATVVVDAGPVLGGAL